MYRVAPSLWRCVSCHLFNLHFRFGKKYAMTLLAGAESVIIPYIGLSKISIYRLLSLLLLWQPILSRKNGK
jgi:hypothetical protein